MGTTMGMRCLSWPCREARLTGKEEYHHLIKGIRRSVDHDTASRLHQIADMADISYWAGNLQPAYQLIKELWSANSTRILVATNPHPLLRTSYNGLLRTALKIAPSTWTLHLTENPHPPPPLFCHSWNVCVNKSGLNSEFPRTTWTVRSCLFRRTKVTAGAQLSTYQLSVLSKAITAVIENQMRPLLLTRWRPQQAGFTPHLPTVCCILVINILTQQRAPTLWLLVLI